MGRVGGMGASERAGRARVSVQYVRQGSAGLHERVEWPGQVGGRHSRQQAQGEDVRCHGHPHARGSRQPVHGHARASRDCLVPDNQPTRQLRGGGCSARRVGHAEVGAGAGQVHCGAPGQAVKVAVDIVPGEGLARPLAGGRAGGGPGSSRGSRDPRGTCLPTGAVGPPGQLLLPLLLLLLLLLPFPFLFWAGYCLTRAPSQLHQQMHVHLDLLGHRAQQVLPREVGRPE
eukprot:scaffold7214_cov114-Isochrysis_galbana.AAC.6